MSLYNLEGIIMPKLTTVTIGSFTFVVDDELWAAQARALLNGNSHERLLMASSCEAVTEARWPQLVARYHAHRRAMQEHA